MSIHSSLRIGDKDKKHRSVLKRYERLKALKDKHLWDEDQSVLGIPKVKTQRFRVKKEKSATPDAETAGTAPGASPVAGKPASTGAPSGKTDKK
ncbi:MAG: hypothetical protein AUJ71_02700 [Candidatus Omnitrophica bacterium CG1_02_49_16]|nr:MAG: hypothetical protein AUJ71_02700 [Candidatus Omnitrophica bacterium CG1_02_49_16]